MLDVVHMVYMSLVYLLIIIVHYTLCQMPECYHVVLYAVWEWSNLSVRIRVFWNGVISH